MNTNRRFWWLLLCIVVRQGWAQSSIANVGPVAVDFGAIKMGATVSVPVTMTNLTAGAINIAGGGLSGAPAFHSSGGNCGGAMIPAGGSCYFTYAFTPTDSSGTPLTAATSILLTAGSVSAYYPLSFSGRGSESLVQVTPVSIDFGNTFIGQTVSVPVTITNTHSATVSLSGGGISGNPAFSSSGGSCGTIAYMPPPGTSCYFTYSFTPSAAGATQSTTGVGFSTTNPINLYQSTPIALKGTGVSTLPSPNVAVWPVTLNYGPIKVGHSVNAAVSYKNNAAVSVSTAGGGFNDSQGGTFAAVGGGGSGCGGSTITSGLTCSVIYYFQPHLAQAYTNSTSIEFYIPNGSSMFVPIAVSGTGVGDLAQISPQTINLGDIAFGTQASVPVTIKNTSDAPLTNFTGGGVNWPFTSNNTCGASLAVGSSCSYTYSFYAPDATNSLKASYSAMTLLAFTNSTGIEPIIQIQLNVRVGDRIFGDGFEN